MIGMNGMRFNDKQYDEKIAEEQHKREIKARIDADRQFIEGCNNPKLLVQIGTHFNSIQERSGAFERCFFNLLRARKYADEQGETCAAALDEAIETWSEKQGVTADSLVQPHHLGFFYLHGTAAAPAWSVSVRVRFFTNKDRADYYHQINHVLVCEDLHKRAVKIAEHAKKVLSELLESEDIKVYGRRDRFSVGNSFAQFADEVQKTSEEQERAAIVLDAMYNNLISGTGRAYDFELTEAEKSALKKIVPVIAKAEPNMLWAHSLRASYEIQPDTTYVYRAADGTLHTSPVTQNGLKGSNYGITFKNI